MTIKNETKNLTNKIRTEKNKERLKKKITKKIAKASESRKKLICDLEAHNISVSKKLKYSRNKMRIVLAETKKFPQAAPNILLYSWKEFLNKPNCAKFAADALGLKEFKALYLKYTGREYKKSEK